MAQNAPDQRMNGDAHDAPRIQPHHRCNGEVKLVEFKLQKFPWDVFVLLWTTMALMAIGIPYFAKTIPPVHRTDIKWWMSGVVYHVPIPTEEHRNYFKDLAGSLDDLGSLGVAAIRVSDFFQRAPDGSVTDYMQPNSVYGSMEHFEHLMDTLVRKDMRLIIDVPLAYTSVSHGWFSQDKRHRSTDSVYVWQQSLDEDKQPSIKANWHRDETRKEYYQYTEDQHEYAAVNYATNAARRKIQNVFSFWLHRGVSGFILLDYDRLVFHGNGYHSTNHIQFEDDRDILLTNLANLTQTFKQYLVDFEKHELEDPDEPLDVLLAIDLAEHDDAGWDTLYDAGVDMILNEELHLHRERVMHGDVDPFLLRQQVRTTLRRVSLEYRTGWRLCEAGAAAYKDEYNTQNLVNMVQLLLPGAAFLCDAQIPHQNEVRYNVGREHLQHMAHWRRTAAMSWGQTEFSYIDQNTFSFVRYAFGKMYPRYIVIINFGRNPVVQNFTMIRDDLTVPDMGTLHYFTCPESEEGKPSHIINSLVYLNNTQVRPGCGLLVELKIKPPL